MFEQKQAMEQARLMDRFKKLREVQVHQQQMLMQQQQDQLYMLRSEQERVQRMIAKQREMQWGGVGANTVNGQMSKPFLKVTKFISYHDKHA